MGGRLSRQQRRRGEVVDRNRAQRGHGGRRPRPQMSEQRRRTVPFPSRDTERDGQAEQQRGDASVEPGAGPASKRGTDPDPEHRQRRTRKREHADGRRRRGNGAQAGAKRRHRGAHDRPAAAERVGDREQRCRQRAGGDPRRQRRGRERRTGDPPPVQHHQIGQVRAGQQQRCGVGHEHRAVQERPLVDAAAAGGGDQHRGHEHDRGVEVEHRGHDGDQPEQRTEQRERVQTGLRDAGADRLEQPVPGGGLADQQQTGHEREGRPDLVHGVE